MRVLYGPHLYLLLCYYLEFAFHNNVNLEFTLSLKEVGVYCSFWFNRLYLREVGELRILLYEFYDQKCIMSLADELLADLEEGGEDIADESQESDQTKLEDIAEEVEDVTMHVDLDKLNSVHSIAKLRDSKQVFIISHCACSGLLLYTNVRGMGSGNMQTCGDTDI